MTSPRGLLLDRSPSPRERRATAEPSAWCFHWQDRLKGRKRKEQQREELRRPDFWVETFDSLSHQTTHGPCIHTANEVAFIKKQLLEIEAKQSNVLDLLKASLSLSTSSSSKALQAEGRDLRQTLNQVQDYEEKVQ
ncbi:Serine-tRNA synthetase type1 N-terminal protein [Dioscorea alata]|uniref:Serine-tRNA synthetase type1 N-terminal protein n=1 Tax=Dioscorea alata TaxID=55571 RepID=A0ACB7UZ61_DIOAL|nr:Serine-tRNA synthetase type1 N-terminal protein [Dioscorea alata]